MLSHFLSKSLREQYFERHSIGGVPAPITPGWISNRQTPTLTAVEEADEDKMEKEDDKEVRCDSTTCCKEGGFRGDR